MIWLLPETILRIHDEQLAEHGGAEGIDRDKFEAVIARPMQLSAYGDRTPDSFDLAAAYAAAIGCGHPFADGNKRTAWVRCETFLNLNGKAISIATDHGLELMVDLATGRISQADFADKLRAGEILQSES